MVGDLKKYQSKLCSHLILSLALRYPTGIPEEKGCTMPDENTKVQDPAQKYDPAIQGERRSQSSIDTIFKSILDSQSTHEQVEWAQAFYDQQEDHLAMLTKSVQRGRRIAERSLIRQQVVEEVLTAITTRPELVAELMEQQQYEQSKQSQNR